MLRTLLCQFFYSSCIRVNELTEPFTNWQIMFPDASKYLKMTNADVISSAIGYDHGPYLQIKFINGSGRIFTLQSQIPYRTKFEMIDIRVFFLFPVQ